MGIGDIFNKNYSPVFWCQFRIRVTKKKKRCGPANKFWNKNSQSLCSQTSMGNSWIFTLSSRKTTISVKHVLLKKRGALISFQSEISSLLRDHDWPLTRKQEVAPKGNRRDKKSKMHVFANHDHRWWWARDFYRVIADEGEAQKSTSIITLKK